MSRWFLNSSLAFLMLICSNAQMYGQPVYKQKPDKGPSVVTGAERKSEYLPKAEGKEGSAADQPDIGDR